MMSTHTAATASSIGTEVANGGARRSGSQRDPVGLLFGTNFDPTPHVRFDGQVRVVSETGFFFSVGYVF